MRQRIKKPDLPPSRGARRTPRIRADHDCAIANERNAVDPSVSDDRSRPVGGEWDFASIPLFPRGPVERPPLGRWTGSLLRAPETKPTDSAERSADRAADAAIRNQRPARAPLAAKAPDLGAPHWGGGRPLSRDERQWHEPRAGADLGDVRIHEGAAPGRWARLLGARAFTIGRDIVLGAGEYVSGSDAGRRLMAHELSHVVTARAQGPLLARVALTSTDYDALADSLHDAITTSVADKELIFVALQKLERNAAAIKSLMTAYKARHKNDLLTDLKTTLKNSRELGFANTLLGVKGGGAVGAKPPGTPKEYEAVAKTVHTALAAKTIDAESIYAALLPLARDPGVVAKVRSTYKTLFTADLDADLSGKLSGAEQSYALYLLNAPLPAAPNIPKLYKAQPGPGTLPTTTPPPAAGGAVKVETHVPYEKTSGDKATFGFGVGYSGALSADSRWIQFIEREIDYVPKGGAKPKALDKEITSGGGKNRYRLTTVTSSPNWVVDSYDKSNPFFDETNSDTAWRDSASVSIYDSPKSREGEVQDLFKAGHTSVTSRAHFEIFLIRDFSAIYHVEIEITWTFTAPDKPPGIKRLVKATAAVSALPSEFKSALVARYPAYAFIR